MNVKQFEDVDDFLAVAQDFMLEEESLNGLMLGICNYLKKGLYRENPPILTTVTAEGEVVATAVCTPPHNLIVYSRSDNRQGIMKQLAQGLSAYDFPGVTGIQETALAFAREWQELKQLAFQTVMAQGVYELREVVYFPEVPGRMRQAVRDDSPWLVEWLLGFYTDALSGESRETAEKALERHFKGGGLYIWEDENGRPVSMAAKTRETVNGRTVSLVYTPPEFRRRGYATACVAALSQLLLDDGYQFCTLFTDLSNPTSNHIYQQIGYRRIADFNQYDFK